MHHRLLLGSTALVGASVLFGGTALTSSSASAQTFVVTLSGFTEVGAVGATNETLSSGPDRGYDFFMDAEIHVRADGETDGGTKYGSKVELEADEFNSTNVDEVGLYFSGGFGRVELGDDDGAEDVMYVGGEDAQAGTGGIDGDTRNLASVQFSDTSDATKATYFTPRLAGFQLGASYTPDTGNFGAGQGTDNNGNLENSVGGGVNWTGAFGAVNLTLAAVGLLGSGENIPAGGDAQDAQSWAVGGLFGFGGFTAGLGYNSQDDQGGEADIINAGLKYGFGPANVSVGYTYNDTDGLNDDQNVIAASADFGLMPGVVLKGDVTYNTDDPGNDDSAGADQDDTWSGVLSVQLNY
jgi:hypothetical protein